MRFPDTISVQFIELEEGRSSLAIYSRGQLGEYDFGAHRDRLLDWMAKLKSRPSVAGRSISKTSTGKPTVPPPIGVEPAT